MREHRYDDRREKRHERRCGSGGLRGLAACAAALLLSACASLQPARNPPVAPAADRAAQYRVQNMVRGEGNSDTLLLSLTFSGGGMRSAAASYHLLDALRQQPG